MFWFRFNPSDWLGSPHVQGMTAAERGYYIQILCIMWNHNQGRKEWEGLPLSETRLIRAVGARPNAWAKFAQSFIGEGRPLQQAESGYQNERLRNEFMNAQARTHAGQDSASKRWESLETGDGNASESQRQGNANASKSHMQYTDTSTDTERVPPTEVSKPGQVVDPDAVVGLWNGIMVPSGCPKVQKLTGGRRRKIRTRTNRRLGSLEKWENYFRKMATIDWMTGGNDRDWYASFDWAVKNDENVERVAETETKTAQTQAERFAEMAAAVGNQ